MRKHRIGQGLAQATVSLSLVGSLLGGAIGPITPVNLLAPGHAVAQTTEAQKAEADRLLQLGQEQFVTSQFEAAFQSWQQALKLYRELRDRLGEGRIFSNLGSLYGIAGNYSKALEYQEQSLAIAREIKDRRLEGQGLGNLGSTYFALGNYDKAIDYHQQRLAIVRELQDRRGEGQVLRNLGNAYDALGQYKKAIEYHQQSLSIAREIKDRYGEGTTLGSLGNAYDSLSQYDKAIEYHQQSLTITREIKDRLGEGIAVGNLGTAYFYLGNYDKAIEYYQQSLTITREIKDRRSESSVLDNLGNSYASLGNYEKAIEYYQQSLIIDREIKNRSSEGQSFDNLGNAYRALGNYDKAIEYHEQSLAIAREVKNRRSEGAVLGNLGITYNNLGNYGKAIDYHQQSLAIDREIKNRRGEGQSLGNLGNVYYALGNYEKAINYQEQRLAIAREIKDRLGEGTALGNLGLNYYALGRYDKALDYHQQRLAITREIKDRLGEGQSLGNLGLTYDSLGNDDKAIEYYQQSLTIAREIKDRKGEGTNLRNLGSAYYDLGNYGKAIEYQEQALAIARTIKDRSGEGYALANLGLTRLKAGMFSQSEQNLFAAMTVLESLRENLQNLDKVSIADSQRQVYNNLQQALITQNKVESALEVAERGRARAFIELLARRVQPSTAAKPIAISIAAIQQIAKAKQATIVQYSVIYQEALFIWVVQPSGQVAFRQVDLTPLAKKQNTTLTNLINVARCLGLASCEESIVRQGTRQVAFNQARVEENWKPGGFSESNRHLQQLHELLITPIADLLPKDANAPVIFIPQGSLFLVPFAALQDAQENYLIDRHTILTAPSIQVLQLTQQQRERVKQANLKENLVVGNPTMPQFVLPDGKVSAPLAPLPGAEQEAREIAPLLKTQPLMGGQATEAVIVRRMPQARIIHLATHGIFNDQQGLQSAIALAPEANAKDLLNNGWLTADEILNLKLQAELVVLSACDTGRGRITGDGVIGLSRSFFSAGVPSVLVSLWAVPDSPTAVLMTQFYQNLQQQPNKARALRQAMLTTKKNYPHPKDWAAFVLLGEME
ncbi:MAG: tetratricopeptide repeat protein [Leptolyngbyaceae cyanobacterium bins.59]|nr:tetratricopeptide repeat protein [Leptolyngbyaceae cyanobacterium bins.59]